VDKKEILETLDRVFPDSPPLRADEITSHFCEECEAIREALAGKKAKDYIRQPYELMGYFNREPKLILSRGCFALLTPRAFVYFLPVFLSAMIIDPREADVMLDSMPSQFDPGPTNGNFAKVWNHVEQKAREALSLLTPAQREAVAEALEQFVPSEISTILPTYSDAVANLRSGEPTAWRKHETERSA
jgi:hypothetical protein